MAFLDLPPDIVLLILEELSVKDTLALRQVLLCSGSTPFPVLSCNRRPDC